MKVTQDERWNCWNALTNPTREQSPTLHLTARRMRALQPSLAIEEHVPTGAGRHERRRPKMAEGISGTSTDHRQIKAANRLGRADSWPFLTTVWRCALDCSRVIKHPLQLRFS